MYKEEAIYNIHKSYLDNLEKGPFFSGTIPSFEENTPSVNFLGTKVRSRLGIFAGPLLNSSWVDLAAKLGFDLLTYKTIRSKEYPGHFLPNICFVEGDSLFDPASPPKTIESVNKKPSLDALAITNSFGMPSRSNEYLMRDIKEAKQRIKKGQSLIVSFVGTPSSPPSQEDYIADFLTAGEVAKSAGAEILEANFSCPNVSKEEGALYLDPNMCYRLARECVSLLSHKPLIVKVGVYPDENRMEKCLIALAKAGVLAVSGINSYSMKVMGANGTESPLGEGRSHSGICGAPIRLLALDFVKKARKIIDRNNLGLTLIGGGGIVRKEHFNLFLDAGADFVFLASSWMWDPYIALRYKGIIS